MDGEAFPTLPQQPDRGPGQAARASLRPHTRSLIVLGVLVLLVLAAFALVKRGADRAVSTTSPGGQALPWVVLAAGLLAAVLIALMAEQSARRLAFAEELVARRTAELRDALAQIATANAEAVAARADAERKSQVDALTDTYNRGHLIELLKAELNRAERGDATAGILLVDVDDFRWLNEEYGPTAGDIVLVEIAGRMKATLRSYDSLARFDSKRFAVLTPNVPSDEALFHVADALRHVVCSGPVLVEGRELWPTVSVGAARSTETHDPFELLAAADDALAAAHHRGKRKGASSL